MPWGSTAATVPDLNSPLCRDWRGALMLFIIGLEYDPQGAVEARARYSAAAALQICGIMRLTYMLLLEDFSRWQN